MYFQTIDDHPSFVELNIVYTKRYKQRLPGLSSFSVSYYYAVNVGRRWSSHWSLSLRGLKIFSIVKDGSWKVYRKEIVSLFKIIFLTKLRERSYKNILQI